MAKIGLYTLAFVIGSLVLGVIAAGIFSGLHTLFPLMFSIENVVGSSIGCAIGGGIMGASHVSRNIM